MDVTRSSWLGASGLVVLFSAAVIWGDPAALAASTALTSADGSARREAEVSLRNVSAGRLRSLPAVTQVRQYLPDACAGAGGVAGVRVVEDPDPIYSNTLGQFVYPPGIRNLSIADDLVTEAVGVCAITTLKVRVNGGVEEGEGEFTATVSLWDGCPGGTGELIPDTTFVFPGLPDNEDISPELVLPFYDRGICTDGSACLVSLQNCGDGSPCVEDPLMIPPAVWVELSFSTATAGVIAGAPAQRGYSADAFDHPDDPCVSWLGGYPDHPHASFWTEIHVEAGCRVQHLAYLAADPTKPAWIPPEWDTRVGDDLTLIDQDCELGAYELGIIGGAGPYRMDIDLRWPDLETVIPATERVFRGLGEGTLEVARFDVPPGVFITASDQPIWITWQPNRSGTGVPNVGQTLIGSSAPFYAMEDAPGAPGWELYFHPDLFPEMIFYAAVYCRGEAPTGACCPDQPAVPGTDVVCYDDLTPLDCLGSRWLLGAVCEDDLFYPPCGTHACCTPDGGCQNLTYDDCVAICEPDPDPFLCETDDDCPGPRTCGFEGDPSICTPKCARWSSGEFCGEGEQWCPVFACFDAWGDCFEVIPEIMCDDDLDCPPGQYCLLPGHICSWRTGCNDLACCDAVCRAPFGDYCCEVAWDPTCVVLAEDLCGVTDSDGDGVPDIADNCPDDHNPDQADADGDHVGDACDGCPQDPNKTEPGICGCGVPDTDSDGDGTPDCIDGCPQDPNKIAPGICGCGVSDTDSDNDGTADCLDGCPQDADKIDPGICGCGVPDTDSDNDGTPDCIDGCPNDPNKVQPGICGCAVDDNLDADDDGVPDCVDQCPGVDDAVFAPGCTDAIPSVSEWGLVIMGLALLVAGKIYFGRRRFRPVGG